MSPQPLDKAARGGHRSHRVRTGRADADLEQVEGAANQRFSPEKPKWARRRRMTSEAPFVLFDDARPGGRALLYSEPADTIETRDPGGIRACLGLLRGTPRRRLPQPTRPVMRSSRGWSRSRRPRSLARRPCSGSACSSGWRKSTPGISCPIRQARGRAGSGRASAKPTIAAPWRRCWSTSRRRRLPGQSDLPGRGRRRRLASGALRGAARARPRRPWRPRLHRRALDPEPLARAVLHARGRPRHHPADEGHHASRHGSGAAARRSQAARRKSDDRRPAAQRSVARRASRDGERCRSCSPSKPIRPCCR